MPHQHTALPVHWDNNITETDHTAYQVNPYLRQSTQDNWAADYATPPPRQPLLHGLLSSVRQQFQNNSTTHLPELSNSQGARPAANHWLVTLGLPVGLLLVAGALSGMSLQSLLQPHAWLVVIGGTLLATWASGNQNSSPLQAFQEGFFAATQPLPISMNAMVQCCSQLARVARKDGLFYLPEWLNQRPEGQQCPLLNKGVLLLQDNRDADWIANTLTIENDRDYQHQLALAQHLETAAGYAPTMGIIGAVMGLVHLTQAMAVPATPAVTTNAASGLATLMPAFQSGIGDAFVATLLGVALANFVLLPLASRLKQQARELWRIQSVMIDALVSIHQGDHPRLVQEQLEAFLQAIPNH